MSKLMISLLFISLSTLSFANNGDGPGNNTDQDPLAKENRAVQNAKVECTLSILTRNTDLKEEYDAVYSKYAVLDPMGGGTIDHIYEVPLKVTFDEKSGGQEAHYEDKFIKISLGMYPKGLIYNQYQLILRDQKSNGRMVGFMPIWDRDWLVDNKLLNREYTGIKGRARYSDYYNGDKVYYAPECTYEFL